MVHEIKLLQIHKRRMSILEQQKAKTGVHYNATLEIEIADIRTEIAEIEGNLKRRLFALQNKAALYGISADPVISIEIEDIEAYFNS